MWRRGIAAAILSRNGPSWRVTCVGQVWSAKPAASRIYLPDQLGLAFGRVASQLEAKGHWIVVPDGEAGGVFQVPMAQQALPDVADRFLCSAMSPPASNGVDYPENNSGANLPSSLDEQDCGQDPPAPECP